MSGLVESRVHIETMRLRELKNQLRFWESNLAGFGIGDERPWVIVRGKTTPSRMKW